MEAATNASRLRAGDLEIRPAELTAIIADRPLNLTARELELLTALVEREGRIVSREELCRTSATASSRNRERPSHLFHIRATSRQQTRPRAMERSPLQ